PAFSHPGWDRLDADGIGIGGLLSRCPAPHTPSLENPLESERRRGVGNSANGGKGEATAHARESATTRLRHLLWAMDPLFRPGNGGSTRGPMPIMRVGRERLSTSFRRLVYGRSMPRFFRIGSTAGSPSAAIRLRAASRLGATGCSAPA